MEESALTKVYSGRVYPFTGLDYWTGLLDWTTGLESFWIRHINGVMQIISLVYVDHVTTYERVLAYLC